jgi:preprotein translocase subunit YajC
MSEPQITDNQDVVITASAAAESMPQAPDQIQSTFTSLIPMLLIFVVFYFLLIRPQEKKRKAQEQLVSTAKLGEEVLLHSGIYGKITKINENDNTIMLQISKDSEIKILQTAVADIVSRKSDIITFEKAKDTQPKDKKKGK